MAKLLTVAVRNYLKGLYDVRQRDSWSCSELGHCLRRQWFSRTGAEWEPPSNVLNMMRSFEVGNAADAMVKRWLTKTFPEEMVPDVPVESKEWDLRGELDGIMGDRVIEVKTANSWRYAEIGKAPEKQYFWKQIQAYLWLSGITDGILFVLNMDSKTWKEIEFTLDMDTVARIMAELTILSNALENGAPPDIEEGCSESDRKNCPFVTVCRRWYEQ